MTALVLAKAAAYWPNCPSLGLCDAAVAAWTFVCCLADSGKTGTTQPTICWSMLGKPLGFVESLPHQLCGGGLSQLLAQAAIFEPEFGLVLLGVLSEPGVEGRFWMIAAA